MNGEDGQEQAKEEEVQEIELQEMVRNDVKLQRPDMAHLRGPVGVE